MRKMDIQVRIWYQLPTNPGRPAADEIPVQQQSADGDFFLDRLKQTNG